MVNDSEVVDASGAKQLRRKKIARYLAIFGWSILAIGGIFSFTIEARNREEAVRRDCLALKAFAEPVKVESSDVIAQRLTPQELYLVNLQLEIRNRRNEEIIETLSCRKSQTKVHNP